MTTFTRHAKAWVGAIGAGLTAAAAAGDAPPWFTIAGAGLTAFAVYTVPNRQST